MQCNKYRSNGIKKKEKKDENRRAPNVPQHIVHYPQAIFRVLAASWPTKLQSQQQHNPKWANAQPNMFSNFAALLEMQQIPAKMENIWEDSIVTNKGQLQDKCTIEGPQDPSFLGISCSSACQEEEERRRALRGRRRREKRDNEEQEEEEEEEEGRVRKEEKNMRKKRMRARAESKETRELEIDKQQRKRREMDEQTKRCG